MRTQGLLDLKNQTISYPQYLPTKDSELKNSFWKEIKANALLEKHDLKIKLRA